MGEFLQIRQDRKELIKGLPSLSGLSETGIERDYGNSFIGLETLPREAYSDENDFQECLSDTVKGLKFMPKYHEWVLFSQSDVVEILNSKDSKLKKSLFDEIDVVDIIAALNSNVDKFRELGIGIEGKGMNFDMDSWYSDTCQERSGLYDLRVRQDFILYINEETRAEIKLDIDSILNTDVSILINKN